MKSGRGSASRDSADVADSFVAGDVDQAVAVEEVRIDLSKLKLRKGEKP